MEKLIRFAKLFLYSIFLQFKCGDSEANPGSKLNIVYTLNTCYRNLNNLTAYNFLKVSLFDTNNNVHKDDVYQKHILINEPLYDPSLSLTGYKMIRSDHPPDTEQEECRFICSIDWY